MHVTHSRATSGAVRHMLLGSVTPPPPLASAAPPKNDGDGDSASPPPPWLQLEV